MTRSDFPSPTLYQLNIFQSNDRAKVRAFLPMQNRTNLCFKGMVRQPHPFTPVSYEERTSRIRNDDALAKFQKKFYGETATSSQLNQKRGAKTIDIFERTKAKTYALPQTRKWAVKETSPVPVYVNLDKIQTQKTRQAS